MLAETSLESGQVRPCLPGLEVQHQREEAEAEGLQCWLLPLQLDEQEYFISFLLKLCL